MAGLPRTFFIVSLVNLFLIFHFPDPVSAVVHTVGGDEGWTTSNNYLEWSQGSNFTVGDVLEFDYVRGQHDVVEVTEDIFRSCDDDGGGGSGELKRYENGNDRVTLGEARKYWFICSVSGHCLGGMKVEVDVKAGAGAGDGQVSAPPTDQTTVINGAVGLRSTGFIIIPVALSVVFLLSIC